MKSPDVKLSLKVPFSLGQQAGGGVKPGQLPGDLQPCPGGRGDRREQPASQPAALEHAAAVTGRVSSRHATAPGRGVGRRLSTANQTAPADGGQCAHAPLHSQPVAAETTSPAGAAA